MPAWKLNCRKGGEQLSMNKKQKVLITRYLYGDAWKALAEKCELCYDPKRLLPYSEEELKEKIRDVDVVISMGDYFSREVLENANKLKGIVDMWGGHADEEICREKGIQVMGHDYDPKWIIHSEVEHIMMLMMAVSRRLKEADAFVRKGRFTYMDQANKEMLGKALKGGRLGILGGSRWSGEELTKVATAFDMQVCYWDSRRGEAMEQAGAQYLPKEEVLAESDYVALVVQDSEPEGYLLGEKELRNMKQGVIIVNVTHGHYIDETALTKVLEEGHLGGAGLDKLEKQTRAAQGLLSLPNVILTPHADGAVKDARATIFASMVEKALTLLTEVE